MGIVVSIIDALRRLGSPTQKTAIQRQDRQLQGKRVLSRGREVARSELGEAEQFVAKTEAVSETVAPLSDQELEPILENAGLVDAWIVAFLGSDRRGHFLDDLDAAFGEWIVAADKQGYSNEAVIAIAGSAFGKFCAETLDLRWVRVTDADGSAIALRGRVKDFRAFPFSAISKRIPSGEYDFFKSIYISLQDASRGDWKSIDAT